MNEDQVRGRIGEVKGKTLTKCVCFVFATLILFLIVACNTVPDYYRQANIRVVTNDKIIAGMHFVNGWTVEANNGVTAQRVGNKIADDLGGRGLHDIDVLVELVSRGTLEESNIWSISVYSAQDPASR